MRSSMVFYSSFAKAIKRLPESEQLKAFWSIVNYGIFDEQPEEDGLHMVVFDMAKDQIDANVKRRESGSYGGRPKKEQVTESENHRLSEKETIGYEDEKPNVNVNDNVNVNANANKKYTCVFERIWEVYPRKKEKAAAYKAYKARLSDGFSEDELEQAVKYYAEECEKNKTEQKYIKHGATFFGANTPFMDYLKKDEEVNADESSSSVRLW